MIVRNLLILLCSCLFTTVALHAQQLQMKKPVRFLALGDSYTIGQSVAANGRWPHQLRDSLLARNVPFDSLKIIAKTGWLTNQLQAGIGDEPLAPDWNLVGLLIGVNNQYNGSPIAQYYQEFPALLDSAIYLAGGNKSHVFVVSIPDYAYTTFGQNSNPDLISTELDGYNRINDSIAHAYGVRYFNITPISRQGVADPALVASDGLHPSAKQYTRWVELMLPAFDSAIAAIDTLLSSGLETAKKATVTAFPNPAGDFFNVGNLGSFTHHTLNIANMQGQSMHRKELRGTIRHAVNCSRWSKGTYIWTIVDKSGTIVESGEIIKQNGAER